MLFLIYILKTELAQTTYRTFWRTETCPAAEQRIHTNATKQCCVPIFVVLWQSEEWLSVKVKLT